MDEKGTQIDRSGDSQRINVPWGMVVVAKRPRPAVGRGDVEILKSGGVVVVVVVVVVGWVAGVKKAGVVGSEARVALVLEDMRRGMVVVGW